MGVGILDPPYAEDFEDVVVTSPGRGPARPSPAALAAVAAARPTSAVAVSSPAVVAAAPRLREVLAAMEEELAGSVDPYVLTGLSIGSYEPRMQRLMSRLVLAPLATKYLFLQKVGGAVNGSKVGKSWFK